MRDLQSQVILETEEFIRKIREMLKKSL